MKEIKEKPVGGKTKAPKTKVMQSVPKAAIQQAMIKSRLIRSLFMYIPPQLQVCTHLDKSEFIYFSLYPNAFLK